MDLIYTNADRFPLGQLESFDLDFDTNYDKDFELTVSEYILQRGDWIYIPGTEYGGVIDSVRVNTESSEVVYSGRNFRGILEGKVLTVPDGWPVLSVSGNIDDIINTLFSVAGLDSLYVCNHTDAVGPVDFSFEPFCSLYDGITALAASINLKLTYRFNVETQKVEVTPLLIENHTDYLTYCRDNSIEMSIEENSQAVNHVVCVGYFEGRRYTIHLFLNENNELMPFATTDVPMQDADYILGTVQQQYLGTDEKAETYVADSVQPIENYVELAEKPEDWGTAWGDYYTQTIGTDEDGNETVDYEPVQARVTYALLNSRPADWQTNFGKYFVKDGSEYKPVSADVTSTPVYSQIRKQPKDWRVNYSKYYERLNNGIEYYYSAIRGNSVDSYKLQIYKPSDWSTGFKSYFEVKDGKYVAVSNTSSGGVPTWTARRYYTKITTTYAPAFNAANTYVQTATNSTESAPDFSLNDYYEKREAAPPFTGGFFRLVLDHYWNLVSAAIQNISFTLNNKQRVELTDFDADIGDIVGGYEEKTGIRLSAPITNIVLKIQRGVQRSIDYTIGD